MWVGVTLPAMYTDCDHDDDDNFDAGFTTAMTMTMALGVRSAQDAAPSARVQGESAQGSNHGKTRGGLPKGGVVERGG